MNSQERFEEFVDYVYSFLGSKRLFQKHHRLEIEHIAPQIGTQLFSEWWAFNDDCAKALKNDPADPCSGKRIKIFKLEDFGREWHRLGEDYLSPFSILFSEANDRRHYDHLIFHNSSKDVFNTSLAAASLLAYASPASNALFGLAGRDILPVPRGRSLSSHVQRAKRTLRLICRLYLVDFLCFRYSLPYDCEPLLLELEAVLEESRPRPFQPRNKKRKGLEQVPLWQALGPLCIALVLTVLIFRFKKHGPNSSLN